VIVDCLTLFVSNWMMAEPEPARMNAALARVFDAFFARVASRKQTVILVSNEVGLGIVSDNELGRVFRDALGRVNQIAAAAADRVYMLVAGLPIQLKPGRDV
jgi:adenosyl cobinamide kinase/adenosyl cobinamide phosphate guanylyltransferase